MIGIGFGGVVGATLTGRLLVRPMRDDLGNPEISYTSHYYNQSNRNDLYDDTCMSKCGVLIIIKVQSVFVHLK